ncbi:glycosyltransferase [Fructobacillus tropaeoli]|uniref:Catalytic subunit of cellulose synthase and poly-beta-1 n=1 Tax=Fructobacillus tropaeoli TaxID=709323 RepID=A0ABN9YL31_9LACO|nr:glycosyltransferase family 2 protein [Fructobacillus tropaeoli]GIC69918.1 glycosyltransferase family 2 protein [Fructobacillus tropaeoli]CAK1225771.1 6-N-acetylglucosamine synthase (BcsA) [Fructobacillus tropaeoli]
MAQNSTTTDRHSLIFRTKPTVYPLILIIWVILMIFYEWYVFKDSYHPIWESKIRWDILLVLVNQIFVGLFFFYGIGNLVFAFRYRHIKKREAQAEQRVLKMPLPDDWRPKVQLLYTTYNDFIPYALQQCMEQNYENTETVILDNSNNPEYIAMVDQFVKNHPGVKLVRDSNNKHAKAGNLNNYLNGVGKGTYDYFVILDSDELLEEHFVEKCLKMFYYSDIGILQCNHVSGQNHNAFMKTFSRSGNIFWPVQNVVRSAESGWYQQPDTMKRNASEVQVVHKGDTLCFELGHGVMISKACFESIGSIPHMVAEDLCTSIEALSRGWNIKFASQIYGNEAFPVTLTALVVRAQKFCGANLEFLRVYHKRVFHSKALSFYQKLDILSFTLSAPIGAFQYLSLILTGVVFPVMHLPMISQFDFLIPAMICYASQALVDTIFQLMRGVKIWSVVLYEIQSAIVYGSYYFVLVMTTIFLLLKRPAKFVVTPKTHGKITWAYALHAHYRSIIFSVITIVVCWHFSDSPWILLTFLPGCIGFLFELQANLQTKETKATNALLRRESKLALVGDRNYRLDWRA